MIPRRPAEPPTPSNHATTVFCADRERRGLLTERLPSANVHAFAMDTVLAAVRSEAEKIVLDLDGVEGREADLVSSLRRARPGARIYLLVSPYAEPLARDLVSVGATDYLLLPDGIERLPEVLARRPSPPPPAPAAAEPPPAPSASVAAGGADWKALFEASCELASLASRDDDAVLSDGLHLLVRATRAVRGAIFLLNPHANRLEAHVRAGGPVPAGDLDLADAERSAAECAMGSRAPIVVHLRGDATAAMISLPLKGPDEPFGAMCLLTRQTAAPERAVLDAVERLAECLGRAYLAAGA